MNLDSAAVQASLTDPERFGLIFEQHHRVIWTYLARSAGTSVADDIAGEVFVAAFAQRDRFDPERGSVRAWLYGIATNKLRTALRSEGRARRAFARAAMPDQVPDNTLLIDDIDDLRSRAHQVKAALYQLSRADRELLILAVWEELSYADIAEATGVTIGTVRSRLSRTRGRLRELAATSGELSMEQVESRGDLR